MDARQFLKLIQETFDRTQSGMQEMVYLDKLSVIPDSYWPKIEKEITRTCKRFPSIAEVFTAAQECGWQEENTRYAHHVWEPTDCPWCAGSGLMAVFWSQEMELSDGGRFQVLKIHYLMPYHKSGTYWAQRDHDDIREAYRCECPAGAIKTLPAVRRFGPEVSSVMRRSWAS